MSTTVTMKQFIRRAYELVAEGWVQGALYTGWAEQDEEGDENAALLPKHRGQVQSVCSVGAMRLAFAELVGIEIRRERWPDWDYRNPDGEWVEGWRESVNDQQVTNHPFYEEGMRVLGRAFYAAEQLYEPRSQLDDPEKLLDGDEGRPYTVRDVNSSIIGVNDFSPLTGAGMEELRVGILSAFERAVELAPEDVTVETEGDRVLEIA